MLEQVATVPGPARKAIDGSGNALSRDAVLLEAVTRRRALRLAMKEAVALGLKLRVAGASVVFDGLERLPSALQGHLLREQASGLLWHYLGGTDLDEPALALRDQLGIEPVLVQSRKEARQAVRQLIRDSHAHAGHIGIDLETSSPQTVRPWARLKMDGGMYADQPELKDRAGLSPHTANIATLQLYAGGDRCYVLRGAALQLVLHSHWLRRQHLVAHNAGFELAFLRHHTQDYRAPPGRRTARPPIECTAQATGLMIGVGFGGEKRALDSAALEFLGLTVPKELQLSDWGAPELSPGQLAYAASDAILCWRLFSLLMPQLRRAGRDTAYALQRDAIPAVVDMELRGLLLEREEHRRQCDAWAVELAEARTAYRELTGTAPPTKPAEIQTWLETVLSAAEWKEWPRTEKAGELSTRTGHLQRLVHIESCRPVLAILAHLKLLSTFGPKLVEKINSVTGRVHASYTIAGTKAGRFNCSHPNLQQLPSKAARDFRRCIVAAPGYVLVGADWNQVEVRAAAWLSGDVALNQLYADGRDLHSENAAMITGVALGDVTKDMRSRAKAVTFGALFGQQAPGLVNYAFEAYGVEMSLQEAEAALNNFFRSYPQLEQWRWDNWHDCKATQEVHIGCGRVVEGAWEREGHLRFTQACNLPIQGICADAMLRAIRLVHARLLRARIRGGLVASVHDELVLEVHEVDAAAAAEILRQAMLDAFMATFPRAPTTKVVDVGIGHSWADLKD